MFRYFSLEQIQSVLSGYQQFSSHESVVVAQSTCKHHSQQQVHLIQKKPQGSAYQPESSEVARSRSTSLYEVITNDDQRRMVRHTNTTHHSQQRSATAKPNEDQQKWQSVPIPSSLIHCPLGQMYILSKLHVFSQAFSLANMPFLQAASRKTPCVCSQQNILPYVCVNKNIIS